MSQQPYSLDAVLKRDVLSKEHDHAKDKIAYFESLQQNTNPNAYAAYNAGLDALEERVVQLRTRPNQERNLFDDLNFLLGD